MACNSSENPAKLWNHEAGRKADNRARKSVEANLPSRGMAGTQEGKGGPETSAARRGGRTGSVFSRPDPQSSATGWELTTRSSKCGQGTTGFGHPYSRPSFQEALCDHRAVSTYASSDTARSRRELGATRETPPLTRLRSRIQTWQEASEKEPQE